MEMSALKLAALKGQITELESQKLDLQIQTVSTLEEISRKLETVYEQ